MVITDRKPKRADESKWVDEQLKLIEILVVGQGMFGLLLARKLKVHGISILLRTFY